jgi:hypothetical protein
MRTHRIIRRTIYLVLMAAIAWQSVALARILLRDRNDFQPRSITVEVAGNVERPGVYRVPEGTTQFEILRVAGVRNTSDLTPFNLAGQVETDGTLRVDTLSSPVGVKPVIRLEFSLGEISIIGKDGMSRVVQEGLVLRQGDRVITDQDAQAELSLNSFSRVDLDNFSELTIDKIGVDEEGNPAVDLFQKTGLCWYRIVYAEEKERIRVLTPLATIMPTGKGADFTAEVTYTEATINVTDGVVLVEKQESGEALNVIAGQSITVYNDERPMEVASMAPDAGVTGRFSKLNQLRSETTTRNVPFNFVFFGIPNIFYLISVQYSENRVAVVRLPHNLSLQELAHGFTTLDQAFLHGGPALVGTILERMFNTRIPSYAVFSKEDVVRAVSALGGVTVSVDARAAAELEIPTGRYTLRGQQIVDFLKPSISGTAEAQRRQLEVMRSLYESMKSRNIVVTALMTDQIMAGLESNITPSEAMRHYRNFSSRQGWQWKQPPLPASMQSIRGRMSLEPDLEACRKLLTD